MNLKKYLETKHILFEKILYKIKVYNKDTLRKTDGERQMEKFISMIFDILNTKKD
jgi:hypothetical protein